MKFANGLETAKTCGANPFRLSPLHSQKRVAAVPRNLFMTSFDDNPEAAKIIHEVLELLDEQYLYQFIDKCIEEAAAEYNFKRKTAMTHQDFIHVIGDFVHHIYKTGFWIRQIVSIGQARAEAVALLVKYYQDPYSHGYDTAFLDLLNSKLVRLEYILSQLAEIIKALALYCCDKSSQCL
jgi:hypothetical protein